MACALRLGDTGYSRILPMIIGFTVDVTHLILSSLWPGGPSRAHAEHRFHMEVENPLVNVVNVINVVNITSSVPAIILPYENQS